MLWASSSFLVVMLKGGNIRTALFSAGFSPRSSLNARFSLFSTPFLRLSILLLLFCLCSRFYCISRPRLSPSVRQLVCFITQLHFWPSGPFLSLLLSPICSQLFVKTRSCLFARSWPHNLSLCFSLSSFANSCPHTATHFSLPSPMLFSHLLFVLVYA